MCFRPVVYVCFPCQYCTTRTLLCLFSYDVRPIPEHNVHTRRMRSEDVYMQLNNITKRQSKAKYACIKSKAHIICNQYWMRRVETLQCSIDVKSVALSVGGFFAAYVNRICLYYL